MNAKRDMMVYVKLDEYNDIKDIVNLMKTKLDEANFVLGKIKEIKKREDDEIANWTTELKSVQEKIGVIDQVLKDPGM